MALAGNFKRWRRGKIASLPATLDIVVKSL
jgi:hypothetical protein